MKIVLSLLIVLFASQSIEKPKSQLTADQSERTRAALEAGFQSEYQKLFPGVRVKVFARNSEFAVIFYPGDKSEPVIHILDGSQDFNNPKVSLTGQIKVKP